MKKYFLSILTFCVISQNTLGAGGIPVIDAGAIAQMIKEYEQSIKNYEQMLKDTANFEAQMKELGVNMSSISQILGNTQQLISDTMNGYDNIKEIPKDLYNEVEDVTEACNFLAEKSSYFNNAVSQTISKISSKTNACLSTLSNYNKFDDDINDMRKKLEKITDIQTYNSELNKINNLIKAKKTLEDKNRQEKYNKLISFYDSFEENNKKSPYSKEKMQNDLKELSKQLLKPNNAKQAQALTNSILIKMLEMQQRQYELSLNYMQFMTSIESEKISTQNTRDYKKEYQTPQDTKEYNIFYQNIKEVPKDDLGIPKMF